MSIETHNLSFRDTIFYPDIQIPAHVVTFVSGPSGCGKSTLFKLINGTVSPSSGYITYKGDDIHELDKIQLRRNILFASQVPFLFQGSIYHNFQTFHDYRESACPDPSTIIDFLHECCLDADLDTVCETMSGGERQRIYLAIALSMKPDILLLDEPTSALNSDLSVSLLANLIRHSKESGMTLVVISHDTSLQTKYAENMIQLGEQS